MDITMTTGMPLDFNTSYSDNSHIFGRPIRISKRADGFMSIPILDEKGQRSLEGLEDWCRKVAFLEEAGIEMHLTYTEK